MWALHSELYTPALVRHFGDALAALNWPTLREQLLKLPAAGVEALLESEAFGTDSEDSILTLLATWMRANWEDTDGDDRERLSGLVRLAQLSRHVASCVLLPLCIYYDVMDEDEPAAWFPVSSAHALLLGTYASSLPLQQQKIRNALPSPAWCNMSPRPQCMPDEGLSYEWAITGEELQAALAGEDEDEAAWVYARINGRTRGIVASGLSWRVAIEHEANSEAAGLYLRPALPAAFQVEGWRLGPLGDHHQLPLPIRLTGPIRLYCRRAGEEDGGISVNFDDKDAINLNEGYGKDDAVPLAEAPADEPSPDPLAPWAPYLHEGTIRGSLVLLPSEGRRSGA
ncbi:hypothetical protein HYH03_010547 [Edaphochlamys debaryana]|uniref:BACK domain-containing protein n=1 Tax=Edaphochlamys debaryana TaxID=47281 RepID=A0A835XVQ7_9CHLO|nr:hypothetical protein HYH03_010547 [Edaphochlamys debaryana]|eukprot:KAG2491103.1 hypothetical protein HYH03_010547 [Edaphochlamys debaryana]